LKEALICVSQRREKKEKPKENCAQPEQEPSKDKGQRSKERLAFFLAKLGM